MSVAVSPTQIKCWEKCAKSVYLSNISFLNNPINSDESYVTGCHNDIM